MWRRKDKQHSALEPATIGETFDNLAGKKRWRIADVLGGEQVGVTLVGNGHGTVTTLFAGILNFV